MVQPTALDDFEQARNAITSYYTLSSVEQLAPDKTQVELTVQAENETAVSDEIEALEEAAEAHKESLTTRTRRTANVKK